MKSTFDVTIAASERTRTDLASDLRHAIRGEVRFDSGSRALYATDASNYRQVPIGVVVPVDKDDVVAGVEVCRAHGAPVLPRGGGTSLAGQCCNVAVVFDFTKYMHHIVDLDERGRRARVQPGLVLDTLRDAAERHHLTFGPDPATHTHCTLGGMIGNNSCGVHSVMAGKTVDNVEELDILTYDGLRMRVGRTSDEQLAAIVAEGGRRGGIYGALRELRDRYADLIRQRYPKIPRRVSGYNLDELLPENGFHVARALVGTEGTCVTVLEATVSLVDSPPAKSILVLGYPDVYSAADHVTEILEFGPIGLEGIDDRLIEDMKQIKMHPRDLQLLPAGKGWLMIEFGGASREESDARARAAMAALKTKPDAPSMKLYDDPQHEKLLWRIRESGLGATAHVPNQPLTWEGWEDSAVPPDRLGGYLRDLRRLFEKYGYACSLYGHFGQGCVHTRIDFDLETAEGIARYKSFMDDASDLVVSYGGSLSGEHGDGQSKAQFHDKMFGSELVRAFREFKSVWDPDGKMNPGKIVAPFRIDQNLRLGVDYHPAQPRTHFTFPADNQSLSMATLRCVGVGECRRETGGTMCPSYRVTREEAHSTRGRARLLFEMLQREVLADGWRDDHVKEALDLCLACKGCKSECPINVDMATYKAEFLSHYYEGKLRPRSAYAMGFIHLWARLASRAPQLINALTHARGLSFLVKAMGGISTAREMPRFADRTFVEWFASRRPRHRPNAMNAHKSATTGMPVVLWPDTFNNHFHPETAQAAVDVLEHAGCTVVVPSQRLCCGRPLYDYGFLVHAKRLLVEVLDAMRPHIRAGTPIVVLEPSCLAVFRDELINLFPNDEDAKRLSRQSYLLSEFLAKKVPGYEAPRLNRPVMLHGHCHHKAIATLGDEEALLRKMTGDVESLDSGCCGMAGSFGFEADHYDVSMKVGELVLLPAVRRASDETLIVADGFSCREQVAQATSRRAVHLSQALQLALYSQHIVEPDTAASSRDSGMLAAWQRHVPRRVAAAALVGLGIGLGAYSLRRVVAR